MTDDERVWHRRLAADLFNRTWDLLETDARTADQDAELLAAAFASRFHWGIVGDSTTWVVGDGQISRVAAALGFGAVAVHYGRRAVEQAEAEGWTDYRLVSSYEVLGRGSAAIGDRSERDAWIGRARAALAAIDDPEDRALLSGQIDSVP